MQKSADVYYYIQYMYIIQYMYMYMYCTLNVLFTTGCIVLVGLDCDTDRRFSVGDSGSSPGPGLFVEMALAL